MIYKFRIVAKITKSSKHLTVDMGANNHLFTQSQLDTSNLHNSNFPDMAKSLSHQDWKKLKKTGKILKTVVTRETIEVSMKKS